MPAGRSWSRSRRPKQLIDASGGWSRTCPRRDVALRYREFVRILFVENHAEFTTAVVQTFLGNDEVVVAPSIAAAKACFGALRFDVVLVDYDLDDGKGDELVRWLRAAKPETKIVAVSARETGNEALLAAGADAVCPKLRFSQIQTVLRDLVG
jgi:CheY-like chemotaxis protein